MTTKEAVFFLEKQKFVVSAANENWIEFISDNIDYYIVLYHNEHGMINLYELCSKQTERVVNECNVSRFMTDDYFCSVILKDISTIVFYNKFEKYYNGVIAYAV
jgi:hypothetical protein